MKDRTIAASLTILIIILLCLGSTSAQEIVNGQGHGQGHGHEHGHGPNHNHGADHVCSFMEMLTCWINPCHTSYCASYPEAYCRMEVLPCGCRAAWYMNWREVDCNVPDQFRMRAVGSQSAMQGGRVMGTPNTAPQRRADNGGCPHNVMRVECRENPCWKVDIPLGADCRPNYCGGCIADLYQNGMKLPCNRCNFFQDIIRSSVMVSDNSAETQMRKLRVNSGMNSEPSLPTNQSPNQRIEGTAPWTSGDPASAPASGPRNDRHPASTQYMGSSQTGAAVLALQGNLPTVSDLSSPDPQRSADSPVIGPNALSKPHTPLTGGHGHVDPNDPHLHGSPSEPGNHSHVHTTTTHKPRPTDNVCPRGKHPAVCAKDPCANQVCTQHPGAECRRSKCGNCQAKWYVNGTEVDCEVCPSNVYVASCPMNPCDIYSCPAHPDAVCRWTKCSSCKDKWYVGTEEVTCDIPWSKTPCPRLRRRKCTKRCYQYRCPSDYEAICRVRGCDANCQVEYYKTVLGKEVIVPCQLRGVWFKRN